MKIHHVPGNRPLGQRGIVLPVVGVGLAAVFAFAGIGLGLARLSLAANEAQNAADAAALAGAAAAVRNHDPFPAAHAILERNAFAGARASVALASVVEGFIDADSLTFDAGGNPTNAVMARVRGDVANPFAALLQDPSQEVEKVAYAAFAGLSRAQPTAPIVIGDCLFDQECFADRCMPALKQVPDPADTSGWTGFFNEANASNIRAFVPSPCGGGSRVDLRIGDQVAVTNGQLRAVVDAMECLYNSGRREHLVTVVSCGSFNQTRRVLGFATIVISGVQTRGKEKTISLEALFRADEPGPVTVGGGNFGTGSVTLVAAR